MAAKCDGDHWATRNDNAFAHVVEVLRDAVPSADGCASLQHRVEAILLAMVTAFSLSQRSSDPISETERSLMEECQDYLCECLWSVQPAESYAATWALWWFHRCDSRPSRLRHWVAADHVVVLPPKTDVLGRLIHLALNAAHPWTRRFAGNALALFPLVPEGRGHFGKTVDNDLAVNAKTLPSNLGAELKELATLIVSWYRQQPWTDSELAQRLENLSVPSYEESTERRRQQLLDLLKPKRSSKKS